MPDTPAPRAPESAMIPNRPVPPSVIYAQRVLWLQTAIWAMGAAIGGPIFLAWAFAGSPHGGSWAFYLLAVLWPAFAVSMATVKMRLADRLGRGGSRRARRAVISTELAMTCFGVLWFSTPYSGPVADLAGLVGAGLSLAAALVLMRHRAKHHAESAAVDPEVTELGPGSGPTSYWRQPAPARA